MSPKARPAKVLRPAPPRRRAKQLLLGLVYLFALFGLIVWEYRDHISLVTQECEGQDAEAKSSLYARAYTWMLNWSHDETSSQVSVVAVPEDLEEIQHNYCQARMYFADVLRAVATQHPAEIVLDKFYSPGTCADAPGATREFIGAVQSLNVPVVLGESTDDAAEMRDRACLVRRPQLDFSSANVYHGITRLNPQVEHIPLRWPVLSSEDSTHAELADSLSWTAVKLYDQGFAKRSRIQQLLDSGLQPFAKIDLELPRETSTDLLCSAGTPAARKRWSVDCSRPGRSLNLLGKIVVIGSEQMPDRRLVMGTRMWGFDTQARYIDALLSGSYLRDMPFWLPFLIFAFFVFVIEGLPTLFEVYRPHWKKHPLLTRAFHRRRYVWVLFWTFAFIFGLTVFSLFLGYLPPMAVFGDIFLVVTTRLLFFAAESTETPFLHHEAKG